MTLDEAIEQVRRMDIERRKGRHIENDSLPAILAAMMQAKAALKAAEEGLASCYQVVDWPADGTSSQDHALAAVRAALAQHESKEAGGT